MNRYKLLSIFLFPIFFYTICYLISTNPEGKNRVIMRRKQFYLKAFELSLPFASIAGCQTPSIKLASDVTYHTEELHQRLVFKIHFKLLYCII